MYIGGSFFGTADYTPTAYVNLLPCTSTEWFSDTYVSCGVPRGYGPGRGVAVGVGNEVGEAVVAFEYYDQYILDRGGLPNAQHEFLLTWLRADALQATDGERVDVWVDNSARSNNATIMNGSTFHLRTINDLPTVRLPSRFAAFMVPC